MTEAILTLTCKKMPKKLLLYVNDWTVQKSLFYKQKLQKELEFHFPNLQVDSTFKLIHT